MIKKHCSGHTLIELMIVVAIIAILAAVAVPYMGAYTEGGRIDELKATILETAAAQERFFTTHNRYASRIIDLEHDGLTDINPEIFIDTGIIFMSGIGPVYYVAGNRNTDRDDADRECWVYFGQTPSNAFGSNLVRYKKDQTNEITVDLSGCEHCPTVENVCE